jgi:hypothetical protein
VKLPIRNLLKRAGWVKKFGALGYSTTRDALRAIGFLEEGEDHK